MPQILWAMAIQLASFCLVLSVAASSEPQCAAENDCGTNAQAQGATTLTGTQVEDLSDVDVALAKANLIQRRLQQKVGKATSMYFQPTSPRRRRTVSSTQYYPNIDMVTSGYNVYYSDPSPPYDESSLPNKDPGLVKPLFTIAYNKGKTTVDGRHYVPDGYEATVDMGCSSAFTSKVIRDMYELQEEKSNENGITARLEAGVKFPGVGGKKVPGAKALSASPFAIKAFASAGGKMSYAMKHGSGEKEFQDKKMVRSSAKCASYIVGLNFDTPPDTHPDFTDALTGANSDEAFWTLFDDYGTHFLTTIKMGSRLSVMNYYTNTNYSTVKTVADGLKIGVDTAAGFTVLMKLPVPGAKVKNKNKLLKAKASLLSPRERRAQQAWSDSVSKTEISAVGAMFSPLVEHEDDWQDATSETPVPVQFDSRAICSHPEVDRLGKADACETALKSYCEGHLKRLGGDCSVPEDRECSVDLDCNTDFVCRNHKCIAVPKCQIKICDSFSPGCGESFIFPTIDFIKAPHGKELLLGFSGWSDKIYSIQMSDGCLKVKAFDDADWTERTNDRMFWNIDSVKGKAGEYNYVNLNDDLTSDVAKIHVWAKPPPDDEPPKPVVLNKYALVRSDATCEYRDAVVEYVEDQAECALMADTRQAPWYNWYPANKKCFASKQCYIYDEGSLSGRAASWAWGWEIYQVLDRFDIPEIGYHWVRATDYKTVGNIADGLLQTNSAEMRINSARETLALIKGRRGGAATSPSLESVQTSVKTPMNIGKGLYGYNHFFGAPLSSANAGSDPGFSPRRLFQVSFSKMTQATFKDFTSVTEPITNLLQANATKQTYGYYGAGAPLTYGPARGEEPHYVPDGYKVTMGRSTACESHSKTKSINTVYDFENHQHISVNTGGTKLAVGPLSFGFSYEEDHFYQQNAKNNKRMFATDAECISYVLEMEDVDNPPEPDPTFHQVASQADTAEEYYALFDMYGLEFPTKVIFGARYGMTQYMTEEIYSKAQSSSTSWSASAEAAFNVAAMAKVAMPPGTGAEAVVGVTHQESDGRDEKMSSANDFESKTTFSVGRSFPADGGVDEWVKDVDAEPMPIRFNLISICNHPSLKSKFQECTDYAASYCEEHLAPSKPGSPCEPAQPAECLWDIDCGEKHSCTKGKCERAPECTVLQYHNCDCDDEVGWPVVYGPKFRPTTQFDGFVFPVEGNNPRWWCCVKMTGGCEEVMLVDADSGERNFERSNANTLIVQNRYSNAMTKYLLPDFSDDLKDDVWAIKAIPKAHWLDIGEAQLVCHEDGYHCLDGKNLWHCESQGATPQISEWCKDGCTDPAVSEKSLGYKPSSFCSIKCLTTQEGWNGVGEYCLGVEWSSGSGKYGNIYGCGYEGEYALYVRHFCGTKGCTVMPRGTDDECCQGSEPFTYGQRQIDNSGGSDRCPGTEASAIEALHS